jgi:hypothetical protein
MRSDKSLLVKVLHVVEPNVGTMRQETQFCDLVECLAQIRHSLGRENNFAMNSTTAASKAEEDESSSIVDTMNQTTKAAMKNTTTVAAASPESGANNTAQAAGGGNATRITSTTTSDYDELRLATERMLTALATQATERVGTLKAESLRRLLAVYSLLPFKADKLVNAFDEEVSKRQSLLESAACTVSVEDLLRQAAENAVSANRTVFGSITEDDGSSKLSALKRGLKSIFSGHYHQIVHDNEDDDDGSDNDEEASEATMMQKFTQEIGALLHRVTASVTEVDDCLGQIGTASNIHTDMALQRIMEGANFELGRCRELIENYRRIEFSTGRRKGRYNYDRDIGKRLLSRLFPR